MVVFQLAVRAVFVVIYLDAGVRRYSCVIPAGEQEANQQTLCIWTTDEY